MGTIRWLVGVMGLMVFASGAAWSQAYPSKPVRVIVSFPPAGATDIVARLVFQKVSEQVNQQFIIDNRAGAAGMIAAALVAKSPPDGYTLLVYSQTYINNLHLYEKPPYELKDFIGVGSLTRIVAMLTVHPSMPVRTTKEFIDLAKARPGQIIYGSAGIGAFQHLSMSSLAVQTGMKMNHVPFKGGAPAVIALVSGEIQSILTPVAEVLPQVKAGRVRGIAVSSDKRAADFPDIPTIGETVKGFEFTSWFGAFVPAGTPRPVIDRLNAEIKKALAEPDIGSKLSAQSLDPLYMTPDDFTKFLKFEYDRMKDVVKASGARLD